jgi:type 1 glutamine amidotransferase
MTKRLLIALLALITTAAPASAATLDCPLRDAPFSLASPFMDILLNPAARSAIETEAPGMLAKLPPMFTSTTAPSFSAILSMREAGAMLRISADKMASIADRLKSISVTDADRAARCARYDDDRPAFTLPKGKPRILLFQKMTGFRDGPSVEAAHAAFLDMAKRHGWAMVTTDRGGAITPAILRRFDAVIWNNVSGDVLTLTQRKALKSYIERGGGFVAVHGSAGDPVYFWDWYADTLIGARFIGHPMGPQFQDAQIRLDDPKHPLAAGLPAAWTMNDEWYSFKASPRLSGAHVLATLDEGSYSPVGIMKQNLRMGDHPIAWTRCVGRGRSFYSAIGHRPQTYSDASYRTMLESAIAWAAAGKACAPPAASR